MGRTVTFTGKLNRYTRKQAVELVRQLGGYVQPLSRETDILVVGEKPGKELESARNRGGIAIFEEIEFQNTVCRNLG